VPPQPRLRVYVPLTPTMLRRAHRDGGFGPPPLLAHAVTPQLRQELGEDADLEDCEYAAMAAAGLESLTMLGPDDPPTRVVAAVDVPGWEPRTGDDPTAVTLGFTVPLKRLVAVHVDAPDAATDVTAAREALEGSDHSTLETLPDAVHRCLDHELGWYAAQELGGLLDDLPWGSQGGRATIA
jgi:hypothetical protein